MNIIEASNIIKSYKDSCVLKNVCLSVEKGAFYGIIGKSGSGKTTLLNVLGLITPFESGTLIINGKKNPEVKSKTALLLRRNQIGYLFQNFGLVDNKTVKWNLCLALTYKKLSRKEKENKINSKLDEFGLMYLKDKFIYQLSGGEQQRIAIIRLMLQDSDIIIADEPTSSLDKKNEQIIMTHLQALRDRGKTIVMVTHDNSLESHFTDVYNLDDRQELV